MDKKLNKEEWLEIFNSCPYDDEEIASCVLSRLSDDTEENQKLLIDAENFLLWKDNFLHRLKNFGFEFG